jgi:hypothetical protein
MSIARHLRLSAVCVVFLVTANVEAEAQVGDVLSAIATAGDYFDVADYYANLPGLFSSYNKCLARGFSESLCHSVMAYCAINDLPLGGVAGAFIDAFQLTQLFKVDCGDGICYACCFVPGSLAACHSAFHSEDGSPVINCNELYGGGTHEVGMTLVVDPDPQPGQGCLFTPQTCDHIGICNTSKTPQQIAAINADPQNIIKSSSAANSRSRALGTGVLADWSNFLSGYHTSSDTQSDFIRQRIHPFSALNGFVTGRGCAGWQHKLPDSFPTDWSEAQFRLDDANGSYVEEASHFNGLRQLGLVRLMASIPNLINRLAFVESQVWTPDTIKQYLAPVGDPDTALLQTMSPVALDLLKKNRQLQDYRLLAVPLPGETVSPRLFNGCLLADPPILLLSYQKRSSLGIDLQVEAADSAGSSALEVGLLVLWGDGSATRRTVPPGGSSQTVSHDYATGGKYQVLAIAMNEAGLRTIGALVAETAGTGTNPANAPVPVLSEIQLVDLRAEIDSFAGDTFSMMFELEGWPTADQGYALGISRALPMPLNTAVSFGTVAGWNTSAAPLQGITIRPSRFGAGYLIGFQKSYFTLDRVRVGVYSTKDNRLHYQDVPVTAQRVRLYPVGSNVPVLLEQPTYGPDGRLQIPVQAGGVRYARVDLLFPQSVFTQAIQGPVVDASWTGIVGTVPEVKPNDRSLTAPPQPLDFYTLAPCRVVDTRGANGRLGAPALLPYPDRAFVLTGTCGIPRDAKALSLNVTVTEAVAPGNVRLYPGQASMPNTSTLNFVVGTTRANNAIIGLGDDGSGTIKAHLESSGPVDLILDVNGYFK